MEEVFVVLGIMAALAGVVFIGYVIFLAICALLGKTN